MKNKIFTSILSLGMLFSLSACNNTHHASSQSSTTISSSKTLDTSTENSTETTRSSSTTLDTSSESKAKEEQKAEIAQKTSSTETPINNFSKINENWYTSDSRYNTMPTVKKTVEGQMEELGIDDPVRAIVVNDIQNYLCDLDETVIEASEINQNLEYARTDTFIELRYDKKSPTQELAERISDDLYSISGNRFSIQ